MRGRQNTNPLLTRHYAHHAFIFRLGLNALHLFIIGRYFNIFCIFVTYSTSHESSNCNI